MKVEDIVSLNTYPLTLAIYCTLMNSFQSLRTSPAQSPLARCRSQTRKAWELMPFGGSSQPMTGLMGADAQASQPILPSVGTSLRYSLSPKITQRSGASINLFENAPYCLPSCLSSLLPVSDSPSSVSCNQHSNYY